MIVVWKQIQFFLLLSLLIIASLCSIHAASVDDDHHHYKLSQQSILLPYYGKPYELKLVMHNNDHQVCADWKSSDDSSLHIVKSECNRVFIEPVVYSTTTTTTTTDSSSHHHHHLMRRVARIVATLNNGETLECTVFMAQLKRMLFFFTADFQ